MATASRYRPAQAGAGSFAGDLKAAHQTAQQVHEDQPEAAVAAAQQEGILEPAVGQRDDHKTQTHDGKDRLPSRDAADTVTQQGREKEQPDISVEVPIFCLGHRGEGLLKVGKIHRRRIPELGEDRDGHAECDHLEPQAQKARQPGASAPAHIAGDQRVAVHRAECGDPKELRNVKLRGAQGG